MLKIMRKYQRSWIIKVIFGTIIASFILVAGYGAYTGREKFVAEVGPYKVSLLEYQLSLDKTLDFYRMLYKDAFDEKMKNELKIKEKVMDNLVDKYVLLIKADELGLKISDEELTTYLNSEPAFKRDGVFNKEQYLAVLMSQKTDPEKFEESWKRDRKIQKVAAIIQNTGTFFNESDVWAGYVKEKGNVNLAYSLFDPASFRDKVNISEKELLDLYEKEKGAYRAENAYRLKVFAIDGKSTVKDDVVYMDLLKGKDMEAYGKETGLPVNDLGEMKESDLIRQFKGLKVEDLREMKKKGEISRLVRSADGKSYIFQFVDMTEGKDLDKTLALAKIKEKLIGDKAKALAKLAAEEAIQSKSVSGKNETGFIVRNARTIEKIGEIPEESRGILLLSQTKTFYEKPLEISGKYYVFSYKDEKSPDKQEWEKDKESYTKYFMGKNTDDFFKSFLTEMKAKMKVSINQKEL